jgi:hypothetical protein
MLLLGRGPAQLTNQLCLQSLQCHLSWLEPAAVESASIGWDSATALRRRWERRQRISFPPCRCQSLSSVSFPSDAIQLWTPTPHALNLDHIYYYAHTLTPIYTHVRKPYAYEHFRGTEPADYEIHEGTAGASLSTGTSPTTESIAPVNPGINPEKYEYSCQVEDLNPDRQIPPQET